MILYFFSQRRKELLSMDRLSLYFKAQRVAARRIQIHFTAEARRRGGISSASPRLCGKKSTCKENSLLVLGLHQETYGTYGTY